MDPAALLAMAGPALTPGGLTPGGWAFLTGAVALAGVVRGFTGFGTALVLLPLAAIVVQPVAALVMLTLLELAGPLVLVRRAWAEAERRAVGIMALGMLAGLLPGVALLMRLPAEAFRWLVVIVALAGVAAIASGWRWTGSRGPAVQAGVGVVSGFLGGVTGLSGPPVVVFNLASPLPAAVVRANLILYLLALDAALLAALAWNGALGLGLVVAALLFAPVFVLGNLAGAAFFRALPGEAAAYRPVALALIAAAALAGLPIWG